MAIDKPHIIENPAPPAPPLVERIGISGRERTMAEIRDRLNFGPLSAIFKATSSVKYSPFIDEDAAIESVDAKELEKYWDLATNAPWIRSYLPELIKRLERASKDDSLLEMSSNIKLDFNLSPGFVLTYDLNGFSVFQRSATDKKRKLLDKKLQERMFSLCKKYNISLLQAPAGDAYTFYMKYEDEKSIKKFAAFKAELKTIKFETGLPDPERFKNLEGENLFPDGNFTASIGTTFADTEEINLKLFSGKIASDQAFIDVSGPAYLRSIKLADQAKNGAEEDDIPPEFDFGAFNERVRKFSDHKKMPSNKKVAIAALAVLISASHPVGSFSEAIAHKDVERVTVPGLGVTSIALNLGDKSSKKDLEQHPELYDTLSEKLIKIVDEYSDLVCIYEKDCTLYHFFTKPGVQLPQDRNRILDFINKISKAAKDSGLSYGIGLDYSDSLVITNVKDSSIQKRSGAGIVRSTRLATTKETDKNVRIGMDWAIKAFGNIYEFTVIKGEKGGELLILGLDEANEDTIEGKKLIGADNDLNKISTFIDGIGKNGTLMRIHSNVEGRDLQGVGVSARIRRAKKMGMEKGLKLVSIESNSNNELGSIRIFLEQIYGKSFTHHSKEEILKAAESALVDKYIWEEKTLIILDSKNMSPIEMEYFSKLATAISTEEVGFIFSSDLKLGIAFEEIVVRDLWPEQAAELIFENRKKDLPVDKKELYRACIEAGLAQNKKRYPLTATNIIHIYSPALEVRGDMVTFNFDKVKGIQTGELAHKIRSEEILPERQTIIGLLAHLRLPLSLQHLSQIYRHLKPSKSFEAFEEDIKFLLEKGYLEEIDGLIKLKNESYRTSAIDLMGVEFDKQEISTLFLGAYPFVDSMEENEIKLAHLMTVGSHALKPDIRRLAQKIASYYMKNGFLLSARNVFYKYIKFVENPLLEINSENIDFYLDMAWSMVQSSGSPDDHELANLIYEKILKTKPNDDQKETALWGQYRIMGFKTKMVAEAEAKKIDQDISSLFEENECALNFKLIGLETETPLFKLCLEAAHLYQKIFIYKHYLINLRKAGQELKPELQIILARLKAELERLYGQYDSNFIDKSDKEISATILKLIGAGYELMKEHEKAKLIFARASQEYSKVENPDYIQTNDCVFGELYAEHWMLIEKVRDKKLKDSRQRDEAMKRIELTDKRSAEGIERTIKLGDQSNRANFHLILGNLAEIKIRAIAQCPQSTDTKEQIQAFANSYMTNLKLYYRLRKLTEKADPTPSDENLLKDLRSAINDLPEHLRITLT